MSIVSVRASRQFNVFHVKKRLVFSWSPLVVVDVKWRRCGPCHRYILHSKTQFALLCFLGYMWKVLLVEWVVILPTLCPSGWKSNSVPWQWGRLEKVQTKQLKDCFFLSRNWHRIQTIRHSRRSMTPSILFAPVQSTLFLTVLPPLVYCLFLLPFATYFQVEGKQAVHKSMSIPVSICCCSIEARS